MDKEKIGLFIKTLRKEHNYTQKELAEKLHVTDKAVSKWERGLSLPDVTIMQSLADALQISIYELMQGERSSAKIVETKQMETILKDTVESVSLSQRKKVRMWKKILLTQWILFFCILFVVVVWGRTLVNFCLERWTEKQESLAHICEVDVLYSNSGLESFYIEKEDTEEFLHYYNIYGEDALGNAEKLFTLRQRGMTLDREPRLKWDEKYLYVLFDGLDNEDIYIRMYDDKVGADPQGFSPVLYRYDLETKAVEQIKLKDGKTSLLLDVFTYQGQSIYILARFKSAIGGLNLGVYSADGIYIEENGYFNFNLAGAYGGMQTQGCLVGDSYYIAGQDGIYRIDLKKQTMEKEKNIDLSKALYVQIEPSVEKEQCFVITCENAEEIDEHRNVLKTNTKKIIASLEKT